MSVPKATPTPWSLSILLICVDPAEAERVRQELAEAPARFIVTMAPSLDQAYSELRRKPYDVLLVATGLAGQSALDTLHGAQAIAPRIATVVLAERADAELALCSIESGIQDFLIRGQAAPGTLARALVYATVRHRTNAELVRLRHLSSSQIQRDSLTGLLSREAFVRKLQETLAFGERFGDRPVVLLVDLNGFIPLQERLGQRLAARLLQEVARRLTWCVRRTDPSGRLGTSRLALLLPHVADPKAMEPVTARIRAAIAEPIEVGAWQPQLAARIGVARFPEDGRTAEALLESADASSLQAEADEDGRCAGVRGKPDPLSGSGAA